MSTSETIEIDPEQLGHLLFSKSVDDTAIIMKSDNEHLEASPGFQKQVFERRKLVYLLAGNIIALTNAASQQPSFSHVFAHFTKRVRLLMQQIWKASEADIDAEIEKAASDYAVLLFTDPATNRALSFEWAQEWLRQVGVEEYNPSVLFRISGMWKIQHDFTAKLLARMRIVNV